MEPEAARTSAPGRWLRMLPLVAGAGEFLRSIAPTKRRTTPTGAMVMYATTLGAFVILIVATVFRLHQLFVMACVVGLVLPSCYYVSLISLGSLTSSIASTPRGALHEDQVATVGVRVTNTGRLPRCFSGIGFALPEGLKLHDAGRPGVTVLGKETIVLDFDFVAERRGVYALSDAEFETSDILGVFEFSRPASGLELELVVYPRVYPLRGYATLGGVGSAEAEDATYIRAGHSVEFYGVRQFHYGDELRRIHWPTTARTGRLAVIEFEDVLARAMTVVLDLSAGTDTGPAGRSTLDCAARTAASLAALAVRQGSRFTLVARGARDHSVSLPYGAPSAHEVFEALARVRSDSEVGIGEVCSQAGLTTEEGSTAFLLTSGSGEEVTRAGLSLLTAGVRPTVVVFRPADATLRGVDAEVAGLRGALAAHGGAVAEVHCRDPLAPQLGVLAGG